MNAEAGAASLAQVRATLGEPFYESHGVLLYQVESVAAMSHLPPNLFDLTITSPPYNIGKEYENTLPIDEYVEWTSDWIANVHRLCKMVGSFWLNLGYVEVPKAGKAVPISYLSWKTNPFYLVQEIVWNYGAGVSTKRMFSPRNEKFLWYVKSSESYTFNLDDVRDPNVKYPNQKKMVRSESIRSARIPRTFGKFPRSPLARGLPGAEPRPSEHPTLPSSLSQ